MKLTRTLLAAVATVAFASPAMAQEPSTSSATPPAEAAARTAQPAPAAPPAATAADLTVGAQVFDAQGQPVGTIAEADATGAVLNTGSARGRLNLDAFYKNERGLLIGYSRAEFEGLVNGMGGPETPEAEEAPNG